MKKVIFILGAAVITAMMITSCGGSSYEEVKIGDQVWMTENLNVEEFRNGDPIPHANTFAKWRKAGQEGQPAWCYYENNPANGEKYGKLYNWYAVNDLRGLAPKGWHIPSDKEWRLLNSFLGGSKVAAKKMKITRGWDKSGNGNNESGFSALPSGLLSAQYEYDYEFGGLGSLAIWWSNTERGKDNVWYQHIDTDECGVAQDINKFFGLTVRCIKD
jgi:uncharacterized protein (TIGR02145 family)